MNFILCVCFYLAKVWWGFLLVCFVFILNVVLFCLLGLGFFFYVFAFLRKNMKEGRSGGAEDLEGLRESK